MDSSESAGDVDDGRNITRRKREIPKSKVRKSEREKQKRDHINVLFLKLGKALEVDHQSVHGKASILRETIRLLVQHRTLIDNLKEENAALVSESNYVEIERNELLEEIAELKNEMKKELSEKGNEFPVVFVAVPQESDEGEAGSVSKPCPRYPSDSWPSQILSQRT